MYKSRKVTFQYLLCFMAILAISEAISCKGSAKYKLTFQAEWTQQSHPEDFSSNNNFSSVVGCTHNSSYVMWKPGMNATNGVKDVAERGQTTQLNKEIDEQRNLGNVKNKFQGPGIPGGNGTSKVNDIEVNTEYPLVSAISRIAPSPDWFVGVRDYSLCNETTGEWIDKRVKDLALYDAGTDSAPRFVHTNTPTTPPEPIFLITNTHEGSLRSNNTIKRFGTFTFEKTYEDVPITSDTNATLKSSNDAATMSKPALVTPSYYVASPSASFSRTEPSKLILSPTRSVTVTASKTEEHSGPAQGPKQTLAPTMSEQAYRKSTTFAKKEESSKPTSAPKMSEASSSPVKPSAKMAMTTSKPVKVKPTSTKTNRAYSSLSSSNVLSMTTSKATTTKSTPTTTNRACSSLSSSINVLLTLIIFSLCK